LSVKCKISRENVNNIWEMFIGQSDLSFQTLSDITTVLINFKL
jgi:hypothetical protein